MKKRLPVVIGVILTLAVAIWYGFTDKTHQIYDNNVNTAVYSAIGIPHGDGYTVEQTFDCDEDRIDAFLIKSDVSGDYENAVVKLQVYDPETGALLSEGEEQGSNIKARKLHKYTVEPIEGYKGKPLRLVVSEENTTETDGITLYYQPGDDNNNFIVNGNPTSGVFIMKTVTQRFDLETCLVMLFAEWFIWGFMWFLYRLFK